MPVAEHVFSVADLPVAEHVRMASYHLRRLLLGDGRGVEASFVGGDLRVHGHLQQHVTQLFAQLRLVAGVDRLQQLVGLLEQVRP